MSKPLKYRADLYAGEVDIGSVSADTIEELKVEINREFLSMIEPGDRIIVIDNDE